MIPSKSTSELILPRQLLLLFALTAVACSYQEPPGKVNQPIKLIALNSMQRIPTGTDLSGKEAIQIMAAKNEYEAFQLIIKAGNDTHLKNIKLQVTALGGPA